MNPAALIAGGTAIALLDALACALLKPDSRRARTSHKEPEQGIKRIPDQLGKLPKKRKS